MSKQNKYYLTSEEFFNEIIRSKLKGEITEELTRMFVLLSERIPNHKDFVRYQHLRHDFIAIGQLACVVSFEKFRPFKDKERSLEWEKDPEPIEYNYLVCNNSFAFFTTCIRNAIIQSLKSEYNQSNILNKKRLDNGLEASYGYVDMIKEQEETEDEDEEEVKQKSLYDMTVSELSVWDTLEEERLPEEEPLENSIEEKDKV